jgi:hypothetical protein
MVWGHGDHQTISIYKVWGPGDFCER